MPDLKVIDRNQSAGHGAMFPSLHGAVIARVSEVLPIERRAQRINESFAKRMLDFVGAFAGLVFLSPVLLMVMLAIKLDSKGPVFFRQSRYGVNKVPFSIVKFRTMTVLETAGAFVQARRDDVRITRVGAFLRKTSLDELPQLWNVLRGDMSLVGPRPHAIVMDDDFARTLPGYADRHLVRPGMTGLAQIQGYRGPTETIGSIRARLACDRIYIRSWSLIADLRIIILTPIRLLGENAF